jgi:hypothetical protein
MPQQTAVEYLLEYIEQNIHKVNQIDDDTYLDGGIYLSLGRDEFENIKEQVKAMYKEEIMKAYATGYINDEWYHIVDENIRAEQYYNENYNKK